MNARNLRPWIFWGALLLANPLLGQYVGDNINLLFNFDALSAPNAPNASGAYPSSGLVLAGNVFLGVCAGGGVNGSGDVYALNVNGLDTNGNGFTN